MEGNGFFRRLVALCRKEFVQLWRDNSSLLIGTVLPILLIIIIGSGINLDVKNAPIAAIYWGVVTAGYLAYSFVTARWEISWIVWPVAGVLYGALAGILHVVRSGG